MNEGVLLLRSVATAIVRLSETAKPGEDTLPYPEEAQRALNQTVLSCLLLKAEPPESLPHLIEWAARRPVDRWPISLPPDAACPDACLLDEQTRQPTELCYEWAVDGEDAAAEHSERRYMAIAAERCREEDYPEAYRAFRELLITRPVLTHRELVTLPAQPDGDLGPLNELLHEVYQPAPAGYLGPERKLYQACARCHTLLHPTAKGGLWCERPRCRDMESVRPGRTFRTDEGGGIQLLIRPLRQWVSAPGLLEMRLGRRLSRMGAHVEMWPGFGAYGMSVSLPNGATLAVEYKDWTNPALLGRRAFPPPPDPPYDRCVWVVPAARLREQPSFWATFERYRPAAGPLGARPELITDRELLRDARQLLGTAPPAPRTDDRENESMKGLF